MRFKKFIIFIVFLLFFFNIFIDSGIAQADRFLIGDFSNESTIVDHIGDNNFCVDTNGNYYIWTFNDTTPYNFTLWGSSDSGDTWTSSVEFSMNDDTDLNQPDYLATCIDGDNIIHIAYGFGFDDPSGKDRYNISYCNYNIGTDTVSSIKRVFTSSDLNVEWDVYGIAIAVNLDDNICVVWNEWTEATTDTRVLSKIYNEQSDNWSDLEEIYTRSGANPTWTKGIAVDTLSNGTFVMSWMTNYGVTWSRVYCGWYDDETYDSGTYFSNTTTQSTSCDKSDIAVDDDDDIHVVWENSSVRIGYIEYDIGTDTALSENLVEDTQSKCPQISISTDDNIHVLFIGDNEGTNYDQVYGYYGSFGSWSSLVWYQTGVVNNMDVFKIPYQNEQTFTKLTDGVIGYVINGTNDNAFHFDEGYELFYGGASEDTEWDVCEGSWYTIEKQFLNSIAYYNSTVRFKIYWDDDFVGPIQPTILSIFNSTDVVVDTISGITANPFYYDYFVDPDYKDGTYYIKVKDMDDTSWSLSCPFTVNSTSGETIGPWSIWTLKKTFVVGETAKVFFNIPSGETGDIMVWGFNNGIAFYLTTYESWVGSSENQYLLYYLNDEYEGYTFALYNASNDVFMDNTQINVLLGEQEWSLLVDGGLTTTVYDNEEVRINYDFSNYEENIYLRIYNDSSYASNYLVKSWSLGYGTATNVRVWNAINESIGDDLYYVTLWGQDTGRINFNDGINRVITVKDGVKPIFDQGWYGLPYWTPYLIGIFLTLFITISPLVLASYVTRKTRIDRVNIPSFVYVGFFFFGMTISVAMTLLPIWLPFIILFGMIIYFAIQWLYGGKGAVEGE